MSKRNGKEYLWIKVTRDKYELPECVFDTAKELAEYEGCTPNSVAQRISRGDGLVRKVEVVG